MGPPHDDIEDLPQYGHREGQGIVKNPDPLDLGPDLPLKGAAFLQIEQVQSALSEVK